MTDTPTPPSPLLELVEGHTGEAEETRILELLRGAEDAAALDALLEGFDLDDLVDSMDNRLFGPKYRTAIIELLTRERLAELTPERKAGVIHALQIGRTPKDQEEAIARVVTSCAGEELTELKNRLNSRSDHRDLEALVYSDVDSPRIRAQILEHIEREAQTLDWEYFEAKVLCDIDDTVFSSLHDERYPKGAVVPGILAFLEALDRGPTGEPFSTGDLTFVTARPASRLGLMENHSKRVLRRAGIGQKSLLTGSLLALHTHDAMAGRKVKNIEHYHALFPEYHLVFVGDSGQGDMEVARRAWAAFPEHMKGAFIHDVKDMPLAERRALREENIHVVDTYVQAAAIAAEIGAHHAREPRRGGPRGARGARRDRLGLPGAGGRHARAVRAHRLGGPGLRPGASGPRARVPRAQVPGALSAPARRSRARRCPPRR